MALLALPLFTPRLYASDEIKYFVHLRSMYFDGDLQFANEYHAFLTQMVRFCAQEDVANPLDAQLTKCQGWNW